MYTKLLQNILQTAFNIIFAISLHITYTTQFYKYYLCEQINNKTHFSNAYMYHKGTS